MTLCLFLPAQQQHSHNGYFFSPHGTIRALVVFADVVGDTSTADIPGWEADSLPDFKDDLFDTAYHGNPRGVLTSYFSEASFGECIIIGDYYPELVQVNYASVSGDDNNGFPNIINYLNSTNGATITTAHGYSLSQFDSWQFHGKPDYYPKQNTSDNYIDMLIIIWRKNSQYKPDRDGGGSYMFRKPAQLKTFDGVNAYYTVCCDDIFKITRHELGHFLIGGDFFHTGGSGNEQRYFLPNVGGYSILSSQINNMFTYNAWDRWWLGWKHPDKGEEISAITISGDEIGTDFEYGDDIGDGLFVLRDFAQYGDAIRIKFPHVSDIRPAVKNQYLWIENRQLESPSEQFDRDKAKGIRFNIQVGNDIKQHDSLGSLSRANYFVPLSAYGNHDFAYTPLGNGYLASTTSELSNPLTGYHPTMHPAVEIVMDNVIRYQETIEISKMFMNGVQTLPDTPCIGNQYDAFISGRSLSLSSNPPALPLITHTQLPGSVLMPSPNDNRHIFLNGLRVDVVDERADGSVLVRISWYDNRVCDDVRWCGPIIMSDTLELMPSHSIVLDQGLTPTQAFKGNDPKPPFTETTVMKCIGGSLLTQHEGSKVVVKNNSTLVIEGGATYEILDGSELEIEPSGSLIVRDCSTLLVNGSGHVTVHNGAYLCIESGANVELRDNASSINLVNGYHNEGNPVSGYTGHHCQSSTIYYTGNGHINTNWQSPSDSYIQNITYTVGNHLETGGQINAGYDITTAVSNGYVVVPSGASVTMESETGVRLKCGIRVEQGGTLRIR